jgi:hypothetical protein
MGSHRANPTDADKISAGSARTESAQSSPDPAVATPEWKQVEEILTKREAAKVYQLALWPETQRAMPTEFIRSALFAAIQGKDATYLERVEIANANDLSIVYTGHRLTQVHADVWEGIMHLARGFPESRQVKFRAKSFLRLIGRHTGKRQRDELRLWWAHLSATCVEVHDKKKGRRYFGSMLPRGAEQTEGNDSVYVVEINRDLAKLFDRGYSTVDWEQRKRLMKKPLCLWLQHHFSAFPKPITVRTLHTLSGSNAQHLRQFRAKLAVALTELEAAGVLATHRFDGETLHVALPPKGSPKAAIDRGAPRAALPPSEAVAELPAIEMGQEALQAFRKLYPDRDLKQCLTDWRQWPPSRNARNPERAFLGFAKKWAVDH